MSYCDVSVCESVKSARLERASTVAVCAFVSATNSRVFTQVIPVVLLFLSFLPKDISSISLFHILSFCSHYVPKISHSVYLCVVLLYMGACMFGHVCTRLFVYTLSWFITKAPCLCTYARMCVCLCA